MTTQLPIMRDLVLGRPFLEFDPDGPTDQCITQPDLVTKNFIRIGRDRAVPFNVQVAMDLLHANPDIFRNSDSSMPIRSPFPSLWFEWMKDNEKSPDETTGQYNFAALIRDIPDQSTLEVTVLTEAPFGLLRTRAHGYLDLTPDGFLEKIRIKCETGAEYVGDDCFNERNRMITSFFGVLGLCLAALKLINCKNIQCPEAGVVNVKRTGAQKRRKEPARKIKYHTIFLPGGGSRSDGKGGHRATALHKVRGHFKTFTAEKPLMGQHVGTYWWGWQVRGNVENGIVISDYNLEGAK